MVLAAFRSRFVAFPVVATLTTLRAVYHGYYVTRFTWFAGCHVLWLPRCAVVLHAVYVYYVYCSGCVLRLLRAHGCLYVAYTALVVVPVCLQLVVVYGYVRLYQLPTTCPRFNTIRYVTHLTRVLPATIRIHLTFGLVAVRLRLFHIHAFVTGCGYRYRMFATRTVTVVHRVAVTTALPRILRYCLFAVARLLHTRFVTVTLPTFTGFYLVAGCCCVWLFIYVYRLFRWLHGCARTAHSPVYVCLPRYVLTPYRLRLLHIAYRFVTPVGSRLYIYARTVAYPLLHGSLTPVTLLPGSYPGLTRMPTFAFTRLLHHGYLWLLITHYHARYARLPYIWFTHTFRLLPRAVYLRSGYLCPPRLFIPFATFAVRCGSWMHLVPVAVTFCSSPVTIPVPHTHICRLPHGYHTTVHAHGWFVRYGLPRGLVYCAFLRFAGATHTAVLPATHTTHCGSHAHYAPGSRYLAGSSYRFCRYGYTVRLDSVAGLHFVCSAHHVYVPRSSRYSCTQLQVGLRGCYRIHGCILFCVRDAATVLAVTAHTHVGLRSFYATFPHGCHLHLTLLPGYAFTHYLTYTRIPTLVLIRIYAVAAWFDAHTRTRLFAPRTLPRLRSAVYCRGCLHFPTVVTHTLRIAAHSWLYTRRLRFTRCRTLLRLHTLRFTVRSRLYIAVWFVATVTHLRTHTFGSRLRCYVAVLVYLRHLVALYAIYAVTFCYRTHTRYALHTAVRGYRLVTPFTAWFVLRLRTTIPSRPVTDYADCLHGYIPVNITTTRFTTGCCRSFPTRFYVTFV